MLVNDAAFAVVNVAAVVNIVTVASISVAAIAVTSINDNEVANVAAAVISLVVLVNDASCFCSCNLRL